MRKWCFLPTLCPSQGKNCREEPNSSARLGGAERLIKQKQMDSQSTPGIMRETFLCHVAIGCLLLLPHSSSSIFTSALLNSYHP